MLRAVIDTNVVAGAMLTAGLNRRVVRACLSRLVRPLISTALFLEYEDVVTRSGLFKASAGFSATHNRLELLAALASVSEWMAVYSPWRPNLRDEADNHLVELAVAGAASVIVTNNTKDLRSGEVQFPSVRILSPGEFMRELP